MSCEYLLSLLGITAGTYFWMWYLVYEYEVAKGIRETDTAWWNTTLRPPSAHLIVAGLIVTVALWAAVSIIGTAYRYERAPVADPTWSPPDIPQCDKELFERITEGCDEQ